MRSSLSIAAAASCLITNVFATRIPVRRMEARADSMVKPKIFIIDMFDSEAGVWYGIKEFDVLAMNITVGGLSPLYPDVHCTANGDVCQITIGESGMSKSLQ